MTGQRLAPVLLGMGILSYVLGQMLFTYYDLVLHQAPPFPSLADIGYLIEYPFFLLGILLLPDLRDFTLAAHEARELERQVMGWGL